jgi:hypothetical protein
MESSKPWQSSAPRLRRACSFATTL